MDELKTVVASNLIQLRTGAGMTQAELGEKLSYSDKSISKWERAESLPDAYVLTQLGEIFGVSVDFLLTPHDRWENPKEKKKDQGTFSSAVVTWVSVAGIWTLATLLFVIFWLLLDHMLWFIFVAALPATLITLLVFNSIWRKGRDNQYIVMALVASLFVLVYLTILPYKNTWQLFLVLLPAELVTYLSFHVYKRPKP